VGSSILQYKINEIPRDGVSFDEQLPVPWLQQALAGTEVDVATSSGHACGTIRWVQDTLLVRGRVDGTLHVPCVRCLEPAELAVDGELALVFEEGAASQPSVEELSDGDEPPEAEHTEVVRYSGDVIELGAAVREHLVVALPIAPLCDPDCRGLCAVCGTNKNLQSCACAASLPDARWSALKDVKLS
jgi:uncharacterized protein